MTMKVVVEVDVSRVPIARIAEQIRPLVDPDFVDPLRQFAETIATMKIEGELDEEGEAFESDADDCLEILDSLIVQARQLTGIAPSNGEEHHDEEKETTIS